MLHMSIDQPLLTSVNTAVQHTIRHAFNSCKESVWHGKKPETQDHMSCQHMSGQVQRTAVGARSPNAELQGSSMSLSSANEEFSPTTRFGKHPQVAEGLVPREGQLVGSIDASLPTAFVNQSDQSLMGVGFGFDSLDFDSEIFNGDADAWNLFSDDDSFSDTQLLK